MMTEIKAKKMAKAIEEKYGKESACLKVFNGLVNDLLNTDKENELFVVFFEIMTD